MSEQTKTLTFTAVALAVLALALATRPHLASDISQVAFQKTLNEADPLSAKRLQIVKFNEETASITPFEVAEINGVWSIPSHQGYPADAQQHMADAAVSVMNLRVLGVPSTDASSHVAFGVVNPDIEKLSVGASGVGLRVTMQNGKGDKLVDMIIGREVQGQPGQRYVREVGRDPVYIVRLDPRKLSTRFQDWIEEDLLKINTFDIKQILIKDYSFEIALTTSGFQPTWDRRSEMTLSYNDSGSKWTLDRLKVFDKNAGQAGAGGEYVEAQPGDDEEVNNQSLNTLKNALDDLKIIDVERKPEGLSKNLRAEQEYVKHNEAQQSLASRGFVLVGMPNGEYEMLSSEGEVVCTMKDGVEYVLRFGQITLGSEDGEAKAAGKDEQTKEGSGINRYMFVMARYNDNIIEKPQLAELPNVASEEKKADGADQENATEATDKKATEEKAGDEKTTDEKTTDDKTADAAHEKTAKDSTETTVKGGKSEKDAAAAAREAVEKANQRKLDEYNDKVQKAKERVIELNDRFADWYYVISDSVYKKIHLGRSDVLKKKAPAQDEGGVLNQLDNLPNALPGGTPQGN